MWEIDSGKIFILLGFSLIYLLLQQIKRALVRELDKCIYDQIIEYFLLAEYSWIVLSMIILGDFEAVDGFIGFILCLLARFIYKKFVYHKFYDKMVSKIKRDNIYNK